MNLLQKFLRSSTCTSRRRRRRLEAEVLEPRLLLSAIVFDDLTSEAGISVSDEFGMSTAWVDYNNDGYADLWLGRHTPHWLGENVETWGLRHFI